MAAARDAAHLTLMRALNYHSYMIAPLVARGRTLGALTFMATDSRRHYGPEDLILADELAARCAVALDNARLHAAEQQARQAAERAADRIARLQAVTAALAGSLTPLQVATVVVEQGAAA